MSLVMNMVGGGTGGGIDLTLIASTEQPISPAANTIWINTDQAITGWSVSPVEPSDPSEGWLWVRTGLSSVAGINVLKENALMVYPIATFQYINGVWEPKVAMSYDGTNWIEWRIYLYNAGDECTDLTGSWASGGSIDTSAGFNNKSSFSLNADHIYISVAKVSGVILSTVNKVDLTPYSKLAMTVLSETGIEDDSHGPGSWLTVRTQKTASWNPTNSSTGQMTKLPAGTTLSQAFSAAGTVEIDISSLSGEYYVALAMAGYVAKTAIITEFYLER